MEKVKIYISEKLDEIGIENFVLTFGTISLFIYIVGVLIYETLKQV